MVKFIKRVALRIKIDKLQDKRDGLINSRDSLSKTNYMLGGIAIRHKGTVIGDKAKKSQDKIETRYISMGSEIRDLTVQIAELEIELLAL